MWPSTDRGKGRGEEGRGGVVMEGVKEAVEEGETAAAAVPLEVAGGGEEVCKLMCVWRWGDWVCE